MRLFIIILLALSLTGCATYKAVTTSPLLEASVRIAAGRVLESQPQWVAPAYRFTSMAISSIRQPGITDLATVDDLFLQIIIDELTPEEQDLALMLFERIKAAVVDDLKSRGITEPDKQKLYAVQVLGWINQSAKIRM